ncbi:unnamed protein product, partial [Ascophyllum nodosum]
ATAAGERGCNGGGRTASEARRKDTTGSAKAAATEAAKIAATERRTRQLR